MNVLSRGSHKIEEYCIWSLAVGLGANHGQVTSVVTAASTAIKWADDLPQKVPAAGDGKDTGFDVVRWLKLCPATQTR